MLSGVDVVKLTLLETLEKDLLRKHKEKNKETIMKIIVAMVNEIYGCHNEMSKKIFNTHKKIAETEIKNLGKNHPEFKRPIADSLRFFVQANWMLEPETVKNGMNLFNKAIANDIFIKGGDPPKAQPFLKMVNQLGKKYGITE